MSNVCFDFQKTEISSKNGFESKLFISSLIRSRKGKGEGKFSSVLCQLLCPDASLAGITLRLPAPALVHIDNMSRWRGPMTSGSSLLWAYVFFPKSSQWTSSQCSTGLFLNQYFNLCSRAIHWEEFASIPIHPTPGIQSRISFSFKYIGEKEDTRTEIGVKLGGLNECWVDNNTH